MDIYINKGGRRIGPVLAFKLREMLSDGEVSVDDLAWFEGMDAWQPIREIEALRDTIPGPAAPPRLPEDAPDGTASPDTGSGDRMDRIEQGWTPPPVPPAAVQEELAMRRQLAGHLRGLAWKRGFARHTDQTIIFMAAWFIAWKTGQAEWWHLLNLPLPMHVVIAGIWILAETLCLKLFAATPGKLLLGLRVTAADGSPLTWGQALKRSVFVWIGGLGLGLLVSSSFGMFMLLLQLLFGYLAVTRTGQTFWDGFSGTTVQSRPAGGFGIAAIVVLPVACAAALMELLASAPLTDSMPADLRKAISEFRDNLQKSRAQFEKQLSPDKTPAAEPQPPQAPVPPPPNAA